MVWKYLKKVIKKTRDKTKEKLSPFQREQREKKLKLINEFRKKFEELIRIEVYEPEIVNKLVREFLSNYLNIKVGFTPNEFEKKITGKKIRKDTQRRIAIFLERLDNARYSMKGLTSEKTKTLMEDFLLIIEELK